MQRPKFSIQTVTKDFTSKIRYVVDNTLCDSHGAIRHGQPCWWIRNDSGSPRAAICDKRARKVYTGTSSERASMNKYAYNRKQKEKAA